MVDNVYILETYADQPAVNDDGDGTDWIVITGTYPALFGNWGAQLYMFYEDPFITQGWFYTYAGGVETIHYAVFNGQIENAQGGGGAESIHGGSIANLIYGDPLDVAGSTDALYGNAGADTLIGAGGSDFLYGGLDNDLLFGDSDPFAQDQGYFVQGDDTVHGDNGNDTIYGGWGANVLTGDEGYDTVDYSGFYDDFGNTTYRIVAYLEAGTVVVYARDTFSGTEVVAATDSVTGFEVIHGTSGADLIQGRYSFAPGEVQGNVIYGGAGNDQLTGSNGVDALFGGAGVDHLDDYDNNIPGTTGVDLLNGGTEDDYYFVRRSTTIIIETATGGFDRVTANVSFTLAANVEALLISPFAGAANGTGNAGDNFFEGSAFANDLSGLGGNDYAMAFEGNDTLRGGTGTDSLYGGTENDQLLGGSQSDVLYGGAGLDLLYGGSENDRLYGGSQSDLLQGGLGRDVLRGGSGADSFYFAFAAETSGRNQRDLIEDFTTGQDHIDLHRVAKNQVFIGNAAFHNISKEVRYDAATGILSGDIDGNGAADYVINLGAGTVLVGGDLIL